MVVDKPTSTVSVGANYQLFSYGFLNKGCYRHRSKHCEIQSVTYNNKTGELIIVDSRGINTWAKNFVTDYAKRVLNFSSYEYNAVRSLVYCGKYNIYFALSKGYRLQVFNLNFNETFSITNESAAAHYICIHEESGDLIAVGQGRICIWRYGEILHSTVPSLSTFGLYLKLEIETPRTVHISKVEIDNMFDRMYCLVENEVWCYDMDGRFVFKTQLSTSSHVTACVFTPLSHLLVVGTICGSVYAVTTAGVAVNTFKLYSKSVTGLVIHPSESQLILTSSMDGCIRMISLDTMSEVYTLPAISEGITWMQLRSKAHLLCASSKTIEVFDLNYLCGIWAQLPYQCQSLQVAKSGKRSSKILVMGEDFNVKVYSKRTQKALSTVFPPPPVAPRHAVLSCAYDAAGGLLYLLVGYFEIWVYTTRTDPACRVVAWKTAELCLTDAQHRSKLNKLLGYDEGLPYYQKMKQDEEKCNCLCVLDFKEIEEVGVCGKQLINGIRPLACGMENGTIITVHSHKEKSENISFKITTGAILQMKVNYQTGKIIAITQGKDCHLVQTVDTSNFKVNSTLELESEVLSCYTFKNETLGLGFECGALCIIPSSCTDFTGKLASKQDHRGRVLSVDFDHNADIICTAGIDGYVKLWDREKVLLCDFHLDASLTTACFLNNSRDIIIGFKSHLYIISSNLLNSHAILKDFNFECHSSDSDNDSIVYESPFLKYDTQRLYVPEDTTMESYLVPYDYLNLDQTFLKDSGTNLIINPCEENTASRKASMASSSELSFASTAIYQSVEGSIAGDDLEAEFPYFGLSPTPSIHSASNDIAQFDDFEVQESEEAPTTTDIPKKVFEKQDKLEQKESIKFTHRKLRTMKIDSAKIQGKRKSSQKVPAKAEYGNATPQSVVQHEVKKARAKKMKKTVVRQKKGRASVSAVSQQENIQPAKDKVALATPTSIRESEGDSPLPTDEETDTEETLFGREVGSNFITLNKVSISTITSKEETQQADKVGAVLSENETVLEQDVNSKEDNEQISEKNFVSDTGEVFSVRKSEETGMPTVTIKPSIVESVSSKAKISETLQPFASSSQEQSEESVASESDLSSEDDARPQSEMKGDAWKQDEESYGVKRTPAARTVRFRPAPTFHRRAIVKKERVIAVSKLHETTQRGSSTNQTPLSIFSLAKRRQDSGVSPNASDRISKYRTKTSERKERKEAGNTEEAKAKKRTKAIRIEEEPSSLLLCNERVKRSERTSVTSMSAMSLTDYSRIDINEEKADVMKFCISAMKQSSYSSRRNRINEAQSLSRQSQRPGPIDEESLFDDDELLPTRERSDSFSLQSVASGSTYSSRYRGFVSTPSIRIHQRPCTPASDVSMSVDDDKMKLDYEYYRQKCYRKGSAPQLEYKQRYEQVSYNEGVHKTPQAYHHHTHNVKGQENHENVNTEALKDNNETFKRIQSPGLREELKRRKLLASQRSARHASAMERRSEYKVQARRCISASPTLVRHDPTQISQDERTETVYEYTPPTPLPCTPSRTSKSPSFSKRSIEAKLAGQPFRYGKKFDVDEDNEKTLIAFARMLISQTEKPAILPKCQTPPSIPAKCRDFILVEDSKDKEKQKLTRMEHELLAQRFQGFIDSENTCVSPLVSL